MASVASMPMQSPMTGMQMPPGVVGLSPNSLFYSGQGNGAMMGQASNGVPVLSSINATGAVIKFFTANGTDTIRSTAQAGVGLFFERTLYNGSLFPVVKEITEKGSAYREGSIKTGAVLLAVDGRSCRDITLNDLKSLILGLIGTVVDMTFLKSDDTQRSVKLSRAPVEYWALWDANIDWRNKFEALRSRSKENENLAFKYKSVAEDLQKTVSSLDQSVNTMRTDLARQRDVSRKLGVQNNTLSEEKKNLENGMDNLLKKLSEITLHFKLAESLARDMTEKARQEEASRNNEERVRKMAEDREAQVHKEMMSEVHKRRQIEQRVAEQANRILELEDRLQAAMVAEFDNKRLHGEILMLRSDADSAKADRDSAQAGAKQYETEMLKEQKQVAATMAELEKLKKTLEVVEDKAKAAQIIAEKAVADKEAIFLEEKDLREQNGKISAKCAGAEAKVSKLEVELGNQQVQIEAALKRGDEANTTKAAAVNEKDRIDSAMKMLKSDFDLLKTAHEAAAKEAVLVAKGLEDALARSQSEVETLQMNAKDMSAAAATSKGDYEDKIRAGNEALASAKAELAGCGTKLSYALAEQARLQKLVKELESSLSSANTETGAAVSTQRELDSKASALQARVAKLESDAAARNSELEKQKALAAKEAMEGKSAKASHSKIELQLADLQKQVIQSAASVKDLKVESNSWEEKCAELERKLISREAAMKDNALLTTKVSALEHEVAQLKQDRKQMQDDSGTHLGLLNQTVKKHEQLMEKYNGDMTKLKTESAEELRKVRSEFDELQEERDMFFKELTRFLGMPNPVGVGMALVENQAKDANGQVVKTTVVGGMQGGLAADLSGVIRIGDELVQVNEFLSEDLSLAEVQAAVAGNRGTQVAFRFRRKIAEGEHAGETFDYRIVLKRGAWGPEHVVMTPEDLDMVNNGSWPEAGSVTTENVDMNKITGGVDISLNYEGKDLPDLGLSKKGGRTTSAVSRGGEDVALEKQKMASLSLMNKMLKMTPRGHKSNGVSAP